MKKIFVIVQARMASTRLPGKVMKNLAGRPVLEHVMERCARIPGIEGVICATSSMPDCDVIANFCKTRGYRCFRGSEQDVLSRYYHAAKEAGAEVIIRATSDNPLLSPRINALLVKRYLQGDVRFVTNNIPPSWPYGLDAEIFDFGLLETMHARAKEDCEREHVTPWVRARLDAFQFANVSCPSGDLSHIRLTLDTPDDWAFLTSLAAAYPGDILNSDWTEIVSFLQAHSDERTS